MNIFVSNLSFKLKETDLKALFEGYGAVNSCKIITDKVTGKSRGFGFVEMSDSDGQNAIDGLNDTPVEGREIKVSVARERVENGNRA
ncbi:MAG: RNA recognition motif domain-containing protein [Legionellales bacterium]